MQKRILKKVCRSEVVIFKIKNRRGYAAVCKNHLTEGISIPQAIRRMAKALKRSGYKLG